MIGDGGDDLVVVEAEALGHGGEDALVGLVGHEPVDVLDAEARVGSCGLHAFGDLPDGVLEDLVADHAEMTNGLRGGRAAVDKKQVAITTV